MADACRSEELVDLLTTDVQDLDSLLLFSVRNKKNRVRRTFIFKNSLNNANELA